MSKIKMTEKHPDIDNFLESVSGRKRDGNQCVTCGSTKVDSEDFKDNLSRKEFSISGMCQKCQDSVWS